MGYGDGWHSTDNVLRCFTCDSTYQSGMYHDTGIEICDQCWHEYYHHEHNSMVSHIVNQEIQRRKE